MKPLTKEDADNYINKVKEETNYYSDQDYDRRYQGSKPLDYYTFGSRVVKGKDLVRHGRFVKPHIMSSPDVVCEPKQESNLTR